MSAKQSLTIKAAVDEYVSLDRKIKEAQRRRDELRKQLLARATVKTERAGSDECIFRGTHNLLQIRYSTRRTLDTKTAAALLEELTDAETYNRCWHTSTVARISLV